MNRPGPPPLPAADQKEFEDLIRAAQRPVANQTHATNQDKDSTLHPDAKSKPAPEFDGDVNPQTGERGGPKREPLAWGANGEWTFGGRATDF
ncbi:putative mitochondrial protein, conserved [Tulasnella sp. 419]|nr:putative mitochondrial protein, conserved [Tulasnella sp. 419]